MDYSQLTTDELLEKRDSLTSESYDKFDDEDRVKEIEFELDMIEDELNARDPFED